MNSDELREVDCDDECQTVRWKAADYLDFLDANAEEIEQLNCLVRDKDAEIERLTAEIGYLRVLAKMALSVEAGTQNTLSNFGVPDSFKR